MLPCPESNKNGKTLKKLLILTAARTNTKDLFVMLADLAITVMGDHPIEAEPTSQSPRTCVCPDIDTVSGLAVLLQTERSLNVRCAVRSEKHTKPV